ncbi:MAG: gamma-glutamyltransferase, partial [Candidatus Eremiobacteraeota bacterium]|nr:gamma-glutamyltransferase [Candidatus Eremiobacteraeota bacterium]
MVATEQHYATVAGLRVLRAGGNAVDAAVAIAYALAVVDPCCGNIGGGGFMLLRMHDGREYFIDFREKAPLKATRTMFLDAKGNVVSGRSTKGWLAIGVPGTVLGMESARREFGTMSRAALMAPAIALARDGFIFNASDRVAFEDSKFSGSAIFMPGGAFPKPGSRFVQPQLAATLELISRDGANAFYRGPIARAIVRASEENGGILSLRDFAEYSVEQRAPVHCHYQSYEVTAAPPPSSGGIALCEILNVIAPYRLTAWGWHSAKSVHYVTEAERRAYADRNTYLGDPDFVHNPTTALLASAYAARLRSEIAPDSATPSSQVRAGRGVEANEH